jgi:hypothetical protein
VAPDEIATGESLPAEVGDSLSEQRAAPDKEMRDQKGVE